MTSCDPLPLAESGIGAVERRYDEVLSKWPCRGQSRNRYFGSSSPAFLSSPSFFIDFLTFVGLYVCQSML
jgi:hypothetical protein